jgi:hypothetical protein
MYIHIYMYGFDAETVSGLVWEKLMSKFKYACLGTTLNINIFIRSTFEVKMQPFSHTHTQNNTCFGSLPSSDTLEYSNLQDY